MTQLKKGIISIVSILNKHKRGKIIFGIKDDGPVIGVSIGKFTLRDISKSISENIEPRIYPKIKEEEFEGKKCVVIEFKEKNIPYFAYGRAYMRIADEDRVLSGKKLEELILNKNKDYFRWDKDICSKASLSDISGEKLKRYISDAGLEYTAKEDVLKKLDLVKNNKLTNASIILFGKDVDKYFRLLNLRCAVFSGNDKSSEVIDMTDFHGDLFELIKKAEQYILEHINVGMRLDGLRRINVPEIDKDAFREAIINAFCHRDYYIPQEIQIAIFKDRIEILNPGKLYAGLSIKDILSKPVSERRNSLIADIFHKIDFVEKWGTGIGKIKRLEPSTKFEEISNFFMATFKRKSQE
ncbi:MAG: putative DNA binding domain-containing protein, partial [Nanoarchaeota archaeon]|nr:putative DNA binding domain-containing protein [Nanoarchaeota archaeon]